MIYIQRCYVPVLDMTECGLKKYPFTLNAYDEGMLVVTVAKAQARTPHCSCHAAPLTTAQCIKLPGTAYQHSLHEGICRIAPLPKARASPIN